MNELEMVFVRALKRQGIEAEQVEIGPDFTLVYDGGTRTRYRTPLALAEALREFNATGSAKHLPPGSYTLLAP